MTTIAPVNPAAHAAPASATQAPATASASRYGFGEDGFTFGDLLDIVNPLQHIPVVGTIYRAITGDTMEAGSEIAGGALFGGPIGALLSVADVAFTESTGKPIDRTMLSWVGLDGGSDTPHPVAVANAAGSTAPRPVQMATSAPAPRAIPARIFPAATTRIVPLADYARSPLPPEMALAQPVAPIAPAQIATAEPATVVPPQPAPATTAEPAPPLPASTQPEVEGAQALLAALRDSGVDPASAARAAAAYQASLGLPIAGARSNDDPAQP